MAIDIKGTIVIKYIISVIKSIFCIVIMVFCGIIISDSSYNELENKTVGPEYFNHISSTYFELNTNCQCGEKITERRCSEEQIKSGCFDINIETENLKFKNINSFFMSYDECKEKINLILKEKITLDKIFDLKLPEINACAIVSLIVCIFYFIFVLLQITTCGSICLACCIENPKECTRLLPALFIIVIISSIANIIAPIIFCIFFFSGDLSDYNSFINCYKVNTDKFIKDFNNVYDLHNYCILYITFVCINIFMDILCYIFIRVINNR